MNNFVLNNDNDLDIIPKELDTLVIKNIEIDCLYLSEVSAKKVFFDNCEIININAVNYIKGLEGLYFSNIKEIDLDDIQIINNLKNVSFNNIDVINEEYLIKLDKVESLCVSNTNISIFHQFSMLDTLKTLIIDDDQYSKYKEELKTLKEKGVNIIDFYNNTYEV